MAWFPRGQPDFSYQGKIVKITKEIGFRSSSKLTFDIEALKRILLPYGDYTVAIYAVAGPFRSGKSFLQSLMVSYLLRLQASQNGENIHVNLGPTWEKIRKYFDFKSGQQPLTKGMHILDQPFLLNYVKQGITKKVALFLVDTQGLFDLEASENDVILLGTFNLLLSSLQYYNVRQHIDKKQLDYILKFVNMIENIDGSSFLQKRSLMFIVRDWENDDEDVDYPHGSEGGNKYFEATTQPSQTRAHEHNAVRYFLDKTFEKIPCFLLPEPGKAVKKKGVTLGELNGNFRNFMLELFKAIADPRYIVTRKIGGREITCRELCEYMEVAVDKLRNVKNVKSDIETSYEKQMQNVTSELATRFVNHIETCGESFQELSPLEIENTLNRVKDEVMEEYEKAPKCRDDEVEDDWRQELLSLLHQIQFGFVSCAAAEKGFVSAIRTFHDWVEENLPQTTIGSEWFKEEAHDLRERLLNEMKAGIAADYLYDDCIEHFRVQTNFIIAEIEEEKNRIYENVLTSSPSWTCSSSSLFTATPDSLLPFATMDVPSAVYDVVTSSDQQLALQKSPSGQLNVTLCFGQVKIPLHSKIDLIIGGQVNAKC